MLIMLEIECFVRYSFRIIVIFLKLFVKFDNDFQVRLWQWYYLLEKRFF